MPGHRRGPPTPRAPRARGNPKGRANLPTVCVSRLARCPRIGLRQLPSLWANSLRRHHDPCEKLGLGPDNRPDEPQGFAIESTISLGGLVALAGVGVVQLKDRPK